jgi:hypothetical protein
MRQRIFFWTIGLYLFFNCSGPHDGPLLQLLDAKDIGIEFRNEIIESDTMNVVRFTNIYNGGGVGVADFDLDGKPDLFFTGNMVSSKLFLNSCDDGRINFQDVTEISGVYTDRWCTGVSIADINGDNWPDIYISVSGSSDAERRQNYLFIHQGLNSDNIPTFKELGSSYGLSDKTYSTQAAFIDFDLDSDLDLFIAVNHADQFYGATVNIPTPNKKAYSERSDRLYENIGKGANGHPVFKDVSSKAGILHEGYTLGLVVYDINMDGWPDIYLANDFLSNDIVYINQGDGTFINKIGEYFKHTTFAGMGMDISDYNNDAWPDIFVLDMTPLDHQRQKSMLLPTRTNRFMMNIEAGYYPQYNRNTLQLNNGKLPNGDLSFSEIGQLAGIHLTDWSWTILQGDLNNSGWRDLMVCNGFRRDMQDLDNINYLFGDNVFGTRAHWEQQFVGKVKEIEGIYVNNFLFKNNGDLTFDDTSAEWGFANPSFSNGGIMTDLDLDGDLDIVINNLDELPFIYENQLIEDVGDLNSCNYLRIQLTDNPVGVEALGAKISIESRSGDQYYQHYYVRGYLSSNDPIIHFGLGADSVVNQILVTWPDGTIDVLKEIPANQLLVIHKTGQEKPIKIESKERSNRALLFKDVSKDLDFKVRHEEKAFEDFDIQAMLLHKYSQNGPGLAVGDVNGDGMDDLFFGASRTYASHILIQKIDGTFDAMPIAGSSDFEDMGAVFLDVDADGDKDLYVATGGSKFGAGSNYYFDRLYLNDGTGKLTYLKDAMPPMKSSSSCVTANDFDSDGDLDLFIGGRVTPGRFPEAPQSYLLENRTEKGKVIFKEVTENLAPGLSNIGVVTGAVWTDFNNDHLKDLIVVGEWMPISVFKNTGGGFINITDRAGLKHSDGWWNSITGADFDKDGDIDYIIGNQGFNSWIKASKEQPFLLYFDDYDLNGVIDPLFFNYHNGRIVPFHSRSLFLNQLDFLKSRFPTHRDFAQATLFDLLDQKQLENSRKLFTYELGSCYLENIGDESFRLIPLPNEVQVAPIFGTLPGDFDGDGNYDILMVGNAYSSALRLGWYDASIGYMLKGGGDGTFKVSSGISNGFYVDSDAKSLVKLRSKIHEEIVLVGNNNDQLKALKILDQYPLLVDLDIVKSDHAVLLFEDGTRQKVEFYRGSGYLSMNSAKNSFSKHVREIIFYDGLGKIINEIEFKSTTRN